MSRFFSQKYANLTPYTPGEQPKDMKYVKLNTNESPFAPHTDVFNAVRDAAQNVNLYPDPDCKVLVEKLAARFDVEPEEVIVTNGSDEVLNFAFMAHCDKTHPAVFPDITYGFYPVFSEINNIPYTEIELKSDFNINVSDYCGCNKTVFIANPNAPTGISLSVNDIEKILVSNPDNIVVIDEAYVDFGAESCIPLIKKYTNLLVTQTFSKSRSMAGGRIGFGIADKSIINDLNTVRYSTNPYNINRFSMVAAEKTLDNDDYYMDNCDKIIENREYATEKLKQMGFECTDSKANFIFAKHPRISGGELYIKLKQRGVLVRHFSKEKICEYNRITVGTKEQMDILLENIKQILEGK